MTDYRSKYIKYKTKYLFLKEQYGGLNEQETRDCARLKAKSEVALPSKVKTDCGYVSTDLLEGLNDIDDHPLLILKVGANDTHATGLTSKQKKYFESFDADSRTMKKDTDDLKDILGPFKALQPSTPFISNTTESENGDDGSIGFLNISDARAISRNLREMNRLFSHISEQRGDALLINIDPESPSSAPFVPDTKLFGRPIVYKPYKEFFPLAEGSDDGNEIISKLVEYPGTLLLINAMGSTCYNVFQEILAKRAAADRKTSYWSLVNEPNTGPCQNDIYNDPDHLEKCNIETCE
jgi:hypothetical protein